MDSLNREWKKTSTELDMLKKNSVSLWSSAGLLPRVHIQILFNCIPSLNSLNHYTDTLIITASVRLYILSLCINAYSVASYPVMGMGSSASMLESRKPLASLTLSLSVFVCAAEVAFCGFLWSCSIFKLLCFCVLGQVTGLSVDAEECLCWLQTREHSCYSL